MKFIDLFSGVGGFRSALEELGHECIAYSEIDKFAIKSYKAIYDTDGEIELGNISEISDEDIAKLKNEVDVVVGGSPCFRAGTLISTRDGLKPIEDVKKGDEVLTHENRFRKVVMPMITHADSIYKLRTMNSVPTYVTEEHPFLVVERTKKWKNGKYLYEYSEPTWVKTKDLVKNKHFIKLGNSTNGINTSNITEEEAWLIGRYIADGYLMDSKRKDRKNSFRRDVVFCVGKTKAEEFENNLNEYSFGKSEDRTVYKYRKRNDRLFTMMEKCGRGSQNKEIPREYLDLPLNLLEKLVEGYLSGDGTYKDGVYSATTVSPKLALSLTEAFNTLHNNGTTLTFSKRPDKYFIEGREVNQRDTYRVQTRFSYDKGATPHTVEINGELFTPIRELEKESTDELVYNFEVEEDNSYVANNLVAHNCQSFSIAGNRGGFDDTRGTLFFEYARTVKDIQPKYFIFENVKGMLSHDKGNTIRTVLNTFNDLGYYIDFNVFNSKYYGVPQNRERIYIVGKRKDLVPSPKFHEKKKKKIKLDEIHNWAVENIQYVNLLPELKTVVNKRLVDILEEEVDEKFFLDEEKTERLLERIKNREVKNNYSKQVADYRYDEGLRIREEGISPCLTANMRSMGTDNKDLSNAVYVIGSTQKNAFIGNGDYSPALTSAMGTGGGHVPMVVGESNFGHEEPKITVVGNTSNSGHGGNNVYDVNGIAPTITARDFNGPKQIMVEDVRIRKLTPLECWRLQGFSDEQFDKAQQAGLSNSQLYKQAGNAVTVNVVKYIAKKLFNE